MEMKDKTVAAPTGRRYDTVRDMLVGERFPEDIIARFDALSPDIVIEAETSKSPSESQWEMVRAMLVAEAAPDRVIAAFDRLTQENKPDVYEFLVGFSWKSISISDMASALGRASMRCPTKLPTVKQIETWEQEIGAQSNGIITIISISPLSSE